MQPRHRHLAADALEYCLGVVRVELLDSPTPPRHSTLRGVLRARLVEDDVLADLRLVRRRDRNEVRDAGPQAATDLSVALAPCTLLSHDEPPSAP